MFIIHQKSGDEKSLWGHFSTKGGTLFLKIKETGKIKTEKTKNTFWDTEASSEWGLLSHEKVRIGIKIGCHFSKNEKL